MSNPIKHVRETGEYVQISSDNETLKYWKRVYEEKCRELTRLDHKLNLEINDLEWEIAFLKDQLRQLREK